MLLHTLVVKKEFFIKGKNFGGTCQKNRYDW